MNGFPKNTLIVISNLTVVPNTSVDDVLGFDKWVLRNGHSIWYSSQNREYLEASSFCSDLDSHSRLFEPRYEDLFFMVLADVNALEIGNFWLGLNDVAVEGT